MREGSTVQLTVSSDIVYNFDIKSLAIEVCNSPLPSLTMFLLIICTKEYLNLFPEWIYYIVHLRLNNIPPLKSTKVRETI